MATSVAVTFLDPIANVQGLACLAWANKVNSTNQLMSHTILHFTGPSFFRSCIQLSKCRPKLQNFDFQRQFSMSKNYLKFSKKKKKYNLGAHFFVIDIS